ncbi:MAG: sulfite exporter TauE/SafE family protein [Chlamydiales bacterium]|nr:sulfite exporter TauE/SafE family protein [Chlamydiales bacterium]NCF70471.1 sulfite exporter TauE/SafE family protein [Chlamydiales bacterium]
MTLFLSMLPFYIIGNLHCFGMCGPMVMLLSQNPYRNLYFLGRVLSFSSAGFIAGALGEVLHLVLSRFYIQELVSITFGLLVIILGVGSIFNWHLLHFLPFKSKLEKRVNRLSILMQQHNPWAAFLLGVFTVTLPCGQSLIVFSACAVSADSITGAFNGFAFAALTSPSLFFAMKAANFFRYFKSSYNKIMGALAIIIGLLMLLRGLAQGGIIEHFILNPSYPDKYHIVLY